MIIMKRMVFSLSVERTPYQGPLLLYRSSGCTGHGCCGCPVARSRSTYASNRVAGNPHATCEFFAWHITPEPLSGGRLPGLHHIVERPHLNSTSRRVFYFS